MLESTLSGSAVASENIQYRDARHALAGLVALTEMAAVVASTYVAFVGYHLIVWKGVPHTISYGWICIALAVMYGTVCLADRQYDFLGAEWSQQSLYRGMFALGLAFVFLLAFMFVTGTVTAYSRGTFVAQLVIALPVQLITRMLLRRAVEMARRRAYWRAPGIVVLVFPGVEKPQWMLQQLSSRQEEIRQVHHLETDRSDVQLKKILRDSRTLQCETMLILFDSDSMNAVSRAVDVLSELPVKVQLLPIGMVSFMHCSRVGYFGRARVLEIASGPRWVADQLLKRALDLVVAGATAVLMMPFMLVVAALIKLDSPGPVLFRQVRHGFNNKPIHVLKFRTMVSRPDEGQFRQATRGDARITRVGRILRRTNIDELPQLLNVIRGNMSLVGPRPHAVSHNEMFDGQIARLSRRHNVKPGITGWAQVNGLRGETDTVEKMRARIEHDLYYIDNWSFAFDLQILIQTVLSRKSYQNAY
jgi:Undecaprenyl-phosphate glucose phosphotransferase